MYCCGSLIYSAVSNDDSSSSTSSSSGVDVDKSTPRAIYHVLINSFGYRLGRERKNVVAVGTSYVFQRGASVCSYRKAVMSFLKLVKLRVDVNALFETS